MTANVLHTLRESNITLDHVLDEVRESIRQSFVQQGCD
jgi:hypothetical protein